MAGSWAHVGPPDGRWSLVENMGDAYEAVEQMLWLVLRTIGSEQAQTLLEEEFYPMKRGERPKDAAFFQVEARMDS